MELNLQDKKRLRARNSHEMMKLSRSDVFTVCVFKIRSGTHDFDDMAT